MAARPDVQYCGQFHLRQRGLRPGHGLPPARLDHPLPHGGRRPRGGGGGRRGQGEDGVNQIILMDVTFFEIFPSGSEFFYGIEVFCFFLN